MDNWLKWIIAAACCVVIAVGSLLMFDRYRSWQLERAAAQQRAERAANDLCARNREDYRRVLMGLRSQMNESEVVLAAIDGDCVRDGRLPALPG